MLRLMSLAQGHNAVKPVRLKSVAPLSRVKHSTTEPSSDVVFIMLIIVKMPTIVDILTFMSRINFVLS